MPLKFDFDYLAHQYDTRCASLGGYIQSADMELVVKPRDVIETCDLTLHSSNEVWELTVDCKICMEVVKSVVPEMQHVTCGKCNAAWCLKCYEHLMTPLKAVTWAYKEEFDRWMVPMLKCPFCSSCLVERRWLIQGCLVKTLENDEECREMLEARMYRLYLVNLTLENPMLDFVDVIDE